MTRSARSAVERRHVSSRHEAGSGLIGSFLGAVVFLAFVMTATHALMSLYATSVITALAWDSARSVSTDSSVDVAAADDQLLRQLDGFDNVSSDWRRDDDSTGLTVTVDRPMFLPRGLITDSSLGRIERTVWVRDEELR